MAAFHPKCLDAVTRAVQASEARHAAQVCVITEHTLPFSYLRRNAPVRQRAQMLFGKHRVWDTENNAGVLIYINFVERAVELVADRGLTPSVPQAQWDAWALQLRAAFAQRQYEAGLVAVIESMGATFERVAPKFSSGDSTSTSTNTQPDRPRVL